jgi:hypothetical protein
VTTAPDDEQERWAEADEVLARWRADPPARRLARDRQDSRLFAAALVLVGLALLLALVLLAVDPPPDPGDEPPAWRAVTGVSVAAGGLLFVVIAAALRVPRRRVSLVRGSPLRELTSGQRRELLRQVRGRSPAMPSRIALARRSAEELLDRRGLLVTQAGLLVGFIGLWIADRSFVRTLLTLVLVSVFAGSVVQAARDGHLAHRFLAEHPVPDET